MKPERWKQVDELLEAALERPAPERAQFLDRACSGDEELRRELESLLISDGQAERFIESPPARVAADLFNDEQRKPGRGERIAHYEILEQIGSGGMGEVYLARDTRLGRKVALKFVPPSLTADPQLRARFFREAQLASALDHPNVCTIHEVGQSSSFLFIAMQYAEGVTLKQLIGSRPMKLDALLSISLQVADALAAAHDQGIIHRDIKSHNIIITSRGQAKVLDFGLAKLMDGSGREQGKAESKLSSNLTGTGAVMGTPNYMSPEQARGDRVVVKWVAAQDWSNGRVGMGGLSYVAATAWEAAVKAGEQNVEALKTTITSGILSDLYTLWHTPQGAKGWRSLISIFGIGAMVTLAPPGGTYQSDLLASLADPSSSVLAGDRDHVPLHVHPHGARLQGGRREVDLLSAAQDGADPGDQLPRRVRLGHVVVRTELEPDDLVHLGVLGADHDHRHVRGLPDPSAHLGPGDPGQHQVEQDDVGAVALEVGQRVRAGGRDGDLETFLAQHVGERVGVALFVLHDEYPGHDVASS
jgi:serine/threonine protein kinase